MYAILFEKKNYNLLKGNLLIMTVSFEIWKCWNVCQGPVSLPNSLQSSLQIFCVLKQIFFCFLNSNANIGCFHKYLSVVDYNYFDAVFILHQKLNLQGIKHFVSNVPQNFVVLKNFSLKEKNLRFFAEYYVWF